MVFSETREFAIVREAPGEETWHALVQALAGRRAAGEDMQAIVAALEPELSAWPTSVRREVPLAWIYALARRGRLPEATLANDLILSDRWALWVAPGEFAPLADAAEVQRVLGSPDLRCVRWLDVANVSDDNPYSPGPMVALPGPAALQQASFACNLRSLNLERVVARWDGGVADLVELLASLPALRCLDLSGNGLGDAALATLAQCPHLGRLEQLILDRNQFTVRGFNILQSSPYAMSIQDFGELDWDGQAPDVSGTFARR